MNTPVAIVFFNRIEPLKRLKKVLEQVKPSRIYLISDGARANRQGEFDKVDECRTFMQNLPWECEIKCNFNGSNLGCGKRVTSGLNWVFEQEDRAVIIEDDILPHPSFFRFCDELLERYKNDSRVGMISGECEHFRKGNIDFHGDSYYFDHMTMVWGWATWRRAWALHNANMPYLPKLIQQGDMINVLQKSKYVKAWSDNAMKIYEGQKNTWAGAWATTMYRENMLAIHPVVNPIVNMGLGRSSREGATTKETLVPNACVQEPEEIVFPLQHPLTMIPNLKCDRYCLEDNLYVDTWKKIVRNPKVALLRLKEKCLGKQK